MLFRFAVLLTAGLLLTAVACQRQQANPESAASQVQIRDARVSVEIAETPKAQKLGLGYRDQLPWDQGMLFLYEQPRTIGIWMKGMRFDIDIIWLRGGRIVDMQWRAPHQPQDSLPTYLPREVADMVLEVPAGYAQAQGWRVGDPAKIQISRSGDTPATPEPSPKNSP